MQGQSSNNNVPAKYRIALALSTAFLAHTLILTGLPSPIPDTQEPRHSIQFELVSPGSRASTPQTNETSREAAKETTPDRNPIFEVPPSPVTARSSSQKISDREFVPEPVVHKTVTKNQTQSSPARLAESKPVRHNTTHAGRQAGLPVEQTEDRPIRVTQSPSEKDPYVVELVLHIGKELEKGIVPIPSQQPKTLIMELQLLGNGTLTRAKILKSTEITRLDEIIYRAALAASPYPEPPANNTRNRFEIELVFSLERL